MPSGISISGAASVNAVGKKLVKRGAALALKNAIAMEQTTLRLERDLKQKFLSAQGGENALFGKTGARGNALAVVTGHTRRTIVRAVFRRGAKRLVGVVGSPLESFRAHEFGMTVRGKPMLRIPTRWMKTPAGADRLAGRSARTLSNTFIAKSKAGNLWIFETGTARAKASPTGILPLYLLKPTVKLRARHMLKQTLALSRAYITSQFRGAAATISKGR